MQHGGTAFDEDGRLTPAVDFEYPLDGDRPPSPIQAASDAVHALLFQLVADGRDCEAIGRRALVIAWKAGVLPDVSTQAQLARRMGVTPARASQIAADLTRRQRES